MRGGAVPWGGALVIGGRVGKFSVPCGGSVVGKSELLELDVGEYVGIPGFTSNFEGVGVETSSSTGGVETGGADGTAATNTGGGVGSQPSVIIGAGVTGIPVGLGVVGALSPRLTSKEVPSTLKISATHGSVTTSAAPA
jgi:hypothetical protein